MNLARKMKGPIAVVLIVLTITVVEVSALFDCNFESKCDNWTLYQSWESVKADKHHFGPKVDSHNNSSGHYLIAPSYFQRSPDSSLGSEYLPNSIQNGCLIFNMYILGDITVIINLKTSGWFWGSTSQLITSLELSTTDSWKTLAMEVTGLQEGKWIEIQVKFGSDRQFFAIDDLKLNETSCSKAEPTTTIPPTKTVKITTPKATTIAKTTKNQTTVEDVTQKITTIFEARTTGEIATEVPSTEMTVEEHSTTIKRPTTKWTTEKVNTEDTTSKELITPIEGKTTKGVATSKDVTTAKITTTEKIENPNTTEEITTVEDINTNETTTFSIEEPQKTDSVNETNATEDENSSATIDQSKTPTSTSVESSTETSSKTTTDIQETSTQIRKSSAGPTFPKPTGTQPTTEVVVGDDVQSDPVVSGADQSGLESKYWYMISAALVLAMIGLGVLSTHFYKRRQRILMVRQYLTPYYENNSCDEQRASICMESSDNFTFEHNDNQQLTPRNQNPSADAYIC